MGVRSPLLTGRAPSLPVWRLASSASACTMPLLDPFWAPPHQTLHLEIWVDGVLPHHVPQNTGVESHTKAHALSQRGSSVQNPQPSNTGKSSTHGRTPRPARQHRRCQVHRSTQQVARGAHALACAPRMVACLALHGAPSGPPPQIDCCTRAAIAVRLLPSSCPATSLSVSGPLKRLTTTARATTTAAMPATRPRPGARGAGRVRRLTGWWAPRRTVRLQIGNTQSRPPPRPRRSSAAQQHRPPALPPPTLPAAEALDRAALLHVGLRGNGD